MVNVFQRQTPILSCGFDKARQKRVALHFPLSRETTIPQPSSPMPLRFVVHIPDGPNGSGGRIDGKVILGEMIGDFVKQKRIEIGVVVGGFNDERLMLLVENDAADG